MRRSPLGRVNNLLSSRTLQTDDKQTFREIQSHVPVQVLHPLGVDIAVEDDPVALATLTTNVIDDLTQSVREETIVPFTSCGIKSTVERILVHRLGVNNVGHTLYTVESLEGRQENLPGIGLTTAGWADHHKTMLDLLDLVQL